MAQARDHFLAKGWTDQINTAEKRLSYDWTFTRNGGDEELRVEVKGSTGSGATVNLTAGEVESARAHHSALFVLHSIELERGDDPKARGGTPHALDPWSPDDEDLMITEYRYSVPGRTPDA